MKPIKEAIILLTLAAFICSLQGCATNSNIRSGGSYNSRTSNYSSAGTRQGVTYNQRSGGFSSPASRSTKTYTENLNREDHSTALALGVGTGVVVGIAALITLIVFALPLAFVPPV